MPMGRRANAGRDRGRHRVPPRPRQRVHPRLGALRRRRERRAAAPRQPLRARPRAVGRCGASVVVVGSGPVALAGRLAPLVGEAPGPGRRRRLRWRRAASRPGARRPAASGSRSQRQLPVAHLGTLVARRRRAPSARGVRGAGPAGAGPRDLDAGHVEGHLGPGARLVGVLTTGATAGGEPPLELVGGDDQARASRAASRRAAGGRLRGRARATTGFSSVPTRSISMRTTSPATSQRGGSKPIPTPAGVPVEMMSPGSSVNTVDRYSTCSQHEKIMSSVDASWRRSPLTQVRRRRRWGSPTSSPVTIHGPVGPWVSKDFPRVHVGVRHCQSRTVTSLRTVKPGHHRRGRRRRARGGSGAR